MPGVAWLTNCHRYSTRVSFSFSIRVPWVIKQHTATLYAREIYRERMNSVRTPVNTMCNPSIRYAQRDIGTAVPSVRPSVRPSARGWYILSKRLYTPLRACLATQQRELTRKNQTVRFNVVLLMRCGLNTRTRRHITGSSSNSPPLHKC